MANYAKKDTDWKMLTMSEMDAYLGIIIIMGVTHDTNVSIKDLWSNNNSFRIPFYRNTMSRNRFEEISSCLRFDDTTTRTSRKERDKLAAIREIYEHMRENCIKHYNTTKSVTVDERMIGFRGGVGFRVYMKSKPDKYGIKVWVVADSNTYYVKDFQIYLGKQNNKREVNQAERVVLDLSSSLHEGVNITVDNFFTSISLAQKLLVKNMTILGTVRKNRKGIPKEMTATKGRQEFSSLFMFCDRMQLTSYCPKKGPEAKPVKPRQVKCKICPLPEKSRSYATQFCSKCDVAVCPVHFQPVCSHCNE